MSGVSFGQLNDPFRLRYFLARAVTRDLRIVPFYGI